MLPEQLDLRKLKAFQLVARHGGLRPAARRMRVTVPAVSFLIRKLEQTTGVHLFQRTPGGGLALTRDGEKLLKATNVIFEDVEDALATINEHGRLGGQLTISTSSDSVSYFSPRISHFIKEYPGVELRHHIHTSEYSLRLVSSGAIDIGLGEFPTKLNELKKELVTKSGLTLLCLENDMLFNKAAFRVSDLSQTRIILPPTRSATRKIIEVAFKKAGTKCLEVIETDGCHTARDFVRSGLGAAIVHTVCANRISLRGIRQIDISSHFQKIEFSAIYRRETDNSPVIQAFISHLIAEP